MVELTFENGVIIFLFIMILAGYAMLVQIHKQTTDNVHVIELDAIKNMEK